MERTMSIEEKIKRAEEIYARRNNINCKPVKNSNNVQLKKIRIGKKLIIQLIVSICIYVVIYVVQNNNFVFSQDFINKIKEIMSYDINFVSVFENAKNDIENRFFNKNEQKENSTENNEVKSNEVNVTENTEDNIQNNIGGAQPIEQENIEISQIDQDVQTVISTTSFIKPLDGVISSVYGQRESEIASVPKNHTGLDIAANSGTKIYSATPGEVVLKSSEGDYGNHLKIQIGEISVIYAHCSNMFVNVGDIVVQGQEIAEVGSTGNSTGPHLHFEVRVSERTIDPQLIFEKFGVTF